MITAHTQRSGNEAEMRQSHFDGQLGHSHKSESWLTAVFKWRYWRVCRELLAVASKIEWTLVAEIDARDEAARKFGFHRIRVE